MDYNPDSGTFILKRKTQSEEASIKFQDILKDDNLWHPIRPGKPG